MNMKIVLWGGLLVSLLLPGLAMSEPRLIHVELSYSGSATSYILYQDGVQVCTSNTPDAMDCTVEIGAAPMTFTLTAVDAAGVESPPSAPYVLVPPPADPGVPGNFIPQAAFTTTVTSGIAPLPVSFDASGSSDLGGMIVSYDWEFGDGGAGTGELIDYTFAAPGTYTVTLTVVDDDGASDLHTATITVSAPPQGQTPAPPTNQTPVAVITETPPPAGTSLIGFSGSASSDPDGTIASYAWNFGDGETAVGVSAQHEYTAAGNYTVVLTVTDNQGATSQDQLAVTVVDSPPAPNVLPVASISASSQKRLMHYTWEYTGTAPGLAGFRLYQNSRLACEIANPAAREADCLTHVDTGLVRLWVTSYDQSGVESAPSSALTFDSTGLFPFTGGDAPLAVHFTSGASADPDGTITSYAWDFGDGSIAEGMAVDHLFTGPGSYTVTLTVTDNSGGQTHATTVISVISAQPPIAVNASFSTVQEKSLTAAVSASDPDGSPLTFRVTKNGTLGTATITNVATGVFTYVPKVGAFGADSFSFKANDGTADSNEAVVSIAVQKKNLAPVATDKAVTVQEDKLASATLTATDPDADPLTFTLVSQPAHGVATLVNAATGAFTYKPQANYNGPDSFTFKASDGSLSSAAATVTVTVTAINDAPTATGISLSTSEEVMASGIVTGADPDGDTLTYAIATNGSKGTATITNGATGAFTYTPSPNMSGQDSFVCRVSDGTLSTEATVTVTITAVNDAPTAAAATLSATEAVVATGQMAGSDPDGDPLTYSIVTNGSKGKAVITSAATGAYTYTPFAGKSGQDSFVYRVSDGTLSAQATVTVTIAAGNVAPTAAAATLAASEDVAATGQLIGSDPNGTPLTYSIVTNGSKGNAVVTNAATGAYTYTPFVNKDGQDSFVYRVSDGTLSTEATVTVTIAAVNDAPTAAAATLSATEAVAATGQMAGSDLDGDPLTYSIVTNGSKGKAVITNAATGAYTYTPFAGKSGQDSFVYRVSDGTLSAQATVTVTIAIAAGNVAPTAAAATLSATEEVVATGQVTGSDPDGDPLTYSIVTNGSKGKAVVTNAATGAYTYTPFANKNGQDSFVYRVSDGTLSAQATVTVTIAAVNDAPTAAAGSVPVTEDTKALGNLAGTDIDGDPLTYSIVSNGSQGKAMITNVATGAFSYTPTANKNGVDTFVYRVSDGALSAEATVTLTIASVNDAPTAAAVSVTTKEDVKVLGQLLGADLDGDSLTYAIVTNGSKGKATITNGATGAFSYTPTANKNGVDTFVYRVSDGRLSAQATVTVTITPVNDAPKAAGVIMSNTTPVLAGTDGTASSPATGAAAVSVAAGLALTTAEDVKTTGQLVGRDADGDRLTYSVVTNGSLGTVRILDPATGAFSYGPKRDKNGQDTFVYRVSDGKSSATATVTVTITPVNDAPRAVIDDVQVARGKTVTIPVLANDTDVDGDPLTLDSVKRPAYGKAVVVNGEIQYTANATFVGLVPIVYTITDGKGGTATQRARVTVVQ